MKVASNYVTSSVMGTLKSFTLGFLGTFFAKNGDHCARNDNDNATNNSGEDDQ